MMIFAIDPGPEFSAYVMWDGVKMFECGKDLNYNVLSLTRKIAEDQEYDYRVVIEQIRSMGQAVGQSVFDTVFWSGRFAEAAGCYYLVPRIDVKMHLCGIARAKDSNIIRALKDRFGEMSTKKNPNPVYGDNKIKDDIWQAFALAVTWWDSKALSLE